MRVALWVYLLAEADGELFTVAEQLRFLPYHSNLLAFLEWAYGLRPSLRG